MTYRDPPGPRRRRVARRRPRRRRPRGVRVAPRRPRRRRGRRLPENEELNIKIRCFTKIIYLSIFINTFHLSQGSHVYLDHYGFEVINHVQLYQTRCQISSQSCNYIASLCSAKRTCDKIVSAVLHHLCLKPEPWGLDNSLVVKDIADIW